VSSIVASGIRRATLAALAGVAVLAGVGPDPATAQQPPRSGRERPHSTVPDQGRRSWVEALGSHNADTPRHGARSHGARPEVTTGNVLLRNGRYTELPDAPGAQLTAHRGLNDRGQTAGVYIDDGPELGPDGIYPPDSVHGFIYTPSHHRNGSFRIVDIPGAQVTLPYDINNRGQIVGIYIDEGAVVAENGFFEQGSQHAFVWDRGRVTILDPPDTVYAPNAYSINDRGQIVGVRIDRSGNQIGFLRQPDGRYVTLDPPGAAQNKASGINDRGQVVGPYLDDGALPGPDGRYPAGSLHGYLWDHGRYERLDVPGARATDAADINNRGDVVGEVKDADGRIRGVARQRGRYRFVDGPGEGNTSFPIHVNNRGEMLIPAPGTIEGLVDLVE
jgi:uncharacterized membrane protein